MKKTFIPLIIFMVALFYRYLGINTNTPFWVDEFSSAEQAKFIIKNNFLLLGDNWNHLESHNVTTHLIIAISYIFFGINEFAARIPFVFIGAAVPSLIYLLMIKKGKSVALIAAGLCVFSYFMIVWSRQARGYVLIQAIILLTLIIYEKLKIKIHNRENARELLIIFGAVALAGILTHIFYFIFLLPVIWYIIVNYKQKISKLQMILLLSLSAIIIITIWWKKLPDLVQILSFNNNLWYYHSFLWREYGLITFLGVIGLLLWLKQGSGLAKIIIIYLTLHCAFLFFILPPYTSRYLLTIMPFLFIGTAFSIRSIAGIIDNKYGFAGPIAVIIMLVIVAQGHKFVLKPKKYYSLNHDFREIANIDYNEIYSLIKNRINRYGSSVAVADTWNARLYWYLGTDYPSRYIFRWENEKELINGLPKKTDIITDKNGVRVAKSDTGLSFIGRLSDLKIALSKHEKGFIFIDDSSLPPDVREYAEKNFTKELYLDRYPLEDNPYSVWPATLYSWGFQDDKKE